MITVELVYAPIGAPIIHLHLQVAPKRTVREVIYQSGLQAHYPEIFSYSVGVFSKLVDLNTIVCAGDRIEIYRPLLIDPMEKRRRRAKCS
jgi:putative ubiquitin-RnfH superfamily antitoxin RatB of RatAB toxin-antitoxin module